MTLSNPRIYAENLHVWFDNGRFYLSRGNEDKWFLSMDYFNGPDPWYLVQPKARPAFYADIEQRLLACHNKDTDLTWDAQEEAYVLQVRTYFCMLPGRILLYDYYT